MRSSSSAPVVRAAARTTDQLRAMPSAPLQAVLAVTPSSVALFGERDVLLVPPPPLAGLVAGDEEYRLPLRVEHEQDPYFGPACRPWSQLLHVVDLRVLDDVDQRTAQGRPADFQLVDSGRHQLGRPGSPWTMDMNHSSTSSRRITLQPTKPSMTSTFYDVKVLRPGATVVLYDGKPQGVVTPAGPPALPHLLVIVG